MGLLPISDEERIKDGKMTEELGVELVCCVTQSLFRSRKSLREPTYENCLKSGKRWLRRTLESPVVRQAIGVNPQQWVDINQVFYLAIPALEVQSIPSEANAASGATTSSGLITLNYDTLMKDLERLNDILLIARNCLATTQRAQNLAGESLLDQQVLKLIDLCVRVTARGYDGETPSRAEQPWANVIGAYKKLLITCLQFLHNFIMKNEQRKLLLWLDLFANSKVANEYALPMGIDRDGYRDENGNASLQDQQGHDTTVTPLTENSIVSEKSQVVPSMSKGSNGRMAPDLSRTDSSTQKQSTTNDLNSSQDLLPLDQMSPTDRRAELLRRATQEQRRRESEAQAEAHLTAEEAGELLFGPVKTERGDEFGALRTPQSAAHTLQAAKDQLMARLADQPLVQDGLDNLDQVGDEAIAHSNVQAPIPSDEDDEDREEGDEEDDYQDQEPGDQQRGLLTDIPLVLGPQEIEALPMIIQIGICPGLGSVLHGRDMQGMRCNILLAGEAGRNLLRELLIFIAAWDLQDDEIYFRLMMQIMEAILDNGLMPYAYQTFSEVKDIVSPAQSMVIKILTQIFRGKQSTTPENETDKLKPLKGKVKEQNPPPKNPHANASRRVDIYIVRYIFTIFRSSIIPETCALIYLQGQIKAGAALPEDFPLNLWDMERVYEGVYQFLEFFAVLTESEEWKELLVNWEVVSELVTLLRELEGSIPKAPITANAIPQTVAEAQREERHENQSFTPTTAGPTPVAVERPFELSQSVQDSGDTNNSNTQSVPPQVPTDSSEPESEDSSDPSDFEWRNLKKLVILVLSSLVWKSPTVQSQIRQYGGVEMVLACCNYDANNPYIREHAVMCLRFLLEGSGENKAIVEKLQELGKMPPPPSDSQLAATAAGQDAGVTGVQKKRSGYIEPEDEEEVPQS